MPRGNPLMRIDSEMEKIIRNTQAKMEIQYGKPASSADASRVIAKMLKDNSMVNLDFNWFKK
jgi:hypothetical protein